MIGQCYSYYSKFKKEAVLCLHLFWLYLVVENKFKHLRLRAQLPLAIIVSHLTYAEYVTHAESPNGGLSLPLYIIIYFSVL